MNTGQETCADAWERGRDLSQVVRLLWNELCVECPRRALDLGISWVGKQVTD